MRKRRQRRERGGRRIGRRKEQPGKDEHRRGRVDVEIEELDRRADQAGKQHLPRRVQSRSLSGHHGHGGGILPIRRDRDLATSPNHQVATSPNARPPFYDRPMALDLSAIPALAANLATGEPRDILALALREYGPDLAISFSGAEDVVLIDMASQHRRAVRGCSRSTPAACTRETYQFIEKVRDALRHRDRRRCSRSRRPCRRWCARRGCSRSTRTATRSAAASARSSRSSRALAPLRAWVTGQRKDQSPGTRADVPVIQLDRTFGDAGTAAREVQSAQQLDVEAGVGVHPRARRAVQRAPRSRLRLDRLRAVHAGRSTPASTNAKAAGGGKRRPRRSAGCTPEISPAQRRNLARSPGPCSRFRRRPDRCRGSRPQRSRSARASRE